MKFKVIDYVTKEIMKSNLTFDEAHDYVTEDQEKGMVLVIELDSSESAPALTGDEGDMPHDNAIMAGIR